MNLLFPTQLKFPSYAVRPTAEGEATSTSSLDAFTEFFQQLLRQHASTRSYFDTAGFYLDSANQDNLGRACSAEASQEAIAAVINNFAQQTKGDYVWDPVQNRWVLKLTPL